jgi:hypothetical protein
MERGHNKYTKAWSLIGHASNYERRFANARNIQEVIKPHGWGYDDPHSAHGTV